VTRIEQLGSGAVYCNLIDAMFPGRVAMQRVSWHARNEWEFIGNYKILQQAFAKCKIQKHIDIEKLSKCKYQDNLEFIQWLKRYFDLHNKNELANYDPAAARKNVQVDLSFVEIRNPLKREKEAAKEDSSKNIRKSKSPYDNVKPKINNRSLTLGKPQRESQYFLEKLSKIKEILKNGKKEGDKLNRIQEIMEEIDEDLPAKNESELAEAKMEKAESKKIIEPPKKERKPKP
jgi:RP/EB family microtubule-associated protein